MPLKFKIRRLKRADIRQVISLNRDLAGFHGAKATITAKEFLRHTINSKLSRCLVAEAERKIIGFSVTYDRAHLGNGGRICMVDLLYTHEKFRRYGVGAALMRATTQEAINRGCHKLEVLAYRRNKTSNAFYKKIGFFLQLHTSNKYAIGRKTMLKFVKGKA